MRFVPDKFVLIRWIFSVLLYALGLVHINSESSAAFIVLGAFVRVRRVKVRRSFGSRLTPTCFSALRYFR